MTDIFALLDELQTIARNGLYYSPAGYDHERYQRLMDVTTRTYSDLLELPEPVIRARFAAELGYITPKIGADAAIFNEKGEILLMQRADGLGWCLPCGFVEPNETPAEAVLRETREETGLEISIRQLVGVFTRKPSADYGPHTIIAIVHLCDITGGELTLSHEGLALRYWEIAAMQDWHANHQKYAHAAHAAWQAGKPIPAVYD
jgi:ADP-ribose pyrophosphatase YjhB (NUDIX family)